MPRLGVGQTAFKVGDTGYNLSVVESLLGDASKLDVDVLVLPELSNSGYAFSARDEAVASSEVVPDGRFCRLLSGWSASHRMVVSGLCEQFDGELYNSAAAFADGEHLTTYRKLHLFDNEPSCFLPGSQEPPVVSFAGHKYGIMICFDWAFPEVARILTLKGAQIILHPANLVLPYCQYAMVTRSIENRVFTATANRIGAERDLVFSGMSQMTSPRGEVIVQATKAYSGVLTADLDLELADDKMITKRNHLLRDRRPEVYQRLVEVA